MWHKAPQSSWTGRQLSRMSLLVGALTCVDTLDTSSCRILNLNCFHPGFGDVQPARLQLTACLLAAIITRALQRKTDESQTVRTKIATTMHTREVLSPVATFLQTFHTSYVTVQNTRSLWRAPTPCTALRLWRSSSSLIVCIAGCCLCSCARTLSASCLVLPALVQEDQGSKAVSLLSHTAHLHCTHQCALQCTSTAPLHIQG